MLNLEVVFLHRGRRHPERSNLVWISRGRGTLVPHPPGPTKRRVQMSERMEYRRVGAERHAFIEDMTMSPFTVVA